MTEKEKCCATEVEPAAVLIAKDVGNAQKVICDVCGHSNPPGTAICKMCSNYLEGVK